MSSNHNFSYVFLLFCIASSHFLSLGEAIKKSGITLDLVHRDSRHSPSYNPSKSHFDLIRSAIDRSFKRHDTIIRKTSSRLNVKSTDDMEANISPTGGEYLMSIQLGTPPVETMVIADTGSDLLWTQCAPCKHCYKQIAPPFDPKNTSSYRRISCQSDQCSAVGTSSCDFESNDCIYQVRYGDQSFSNGDLAVETLTLGDVSFPKVVFGCGHENAGTFNETGTGIIGLGGSSISIVKQLEKSIGGRFSYCLTFYYTNVSSKIKFGSDAIVTGPNVVSTPLVPNSLDTFYFVTLEAVSVGGKKFYYNSKSSNTTSGEEGNIILDSGTTLTFLPTDMYNGLETELVNTINATRASDSSGTLNLCYKSPSGREFNSPTIVAHFAGADVELVEEGLFLEVESGVFCLSFVPSDQAAIFGNLHQMNHHIGYDLENHKVDFLPTDCSKSG